MKKIILAVTALFFFSSSMRLELNRMWGFYGHKKINKLAVFTLPEPLFGFYRAHIDVITSRSVNADKRRNVVEGEAPKHYIDLDHYSSDRLAVFDSMPSRWNSAVAKYTEDTLLAYGIVPWVINLESFKLIEAFENKDWEKVIHLSADLGHYIADAHVPLHTTENYNGQLTNQKGIHGLWESRLPELFSDDYDFFIGKATYIEKRQDYIWERLKESHLALDSVLLMEKLLRNSEDAERMYSFEQRGKNVVKQFAFHYADQYHRMLDGMVERRMRKAIQSIGSYWYTAWVMAGQPDLPVSHNLLILAEDTVYRYKHKQLNDRTHE